MAAGDFFRDLQKEVEGWQSDRGTSGAPKSLWEELSVSFPALLHFGSQYGIYFHTSVREW